MKTKKQMTDDQIDIFAEKIVKGIIEDFHVDTLTNYLHELEPGEIFRTSEPGNIFYLKLKNTLRSRSDICYVLQIGSAEVFLVRKDFIVEKMGYACLSVDCY